MSEFELWVPEPKTKPGKTLGECKQMGFKSTKKKINVGDKVQVVDCSGIESGKKGTVIHPSKIKTTGRGIPAEIPGAYRPVDWKHEVAIEYEDGSLGTMAKNRLIVLEEGVSMGFVTSNLFPGKRVEIGPGEGKDTGRTGVIKKSAGHGKWIVVMDDDDSEKTYDDNVLQHVSYGRATKAARRQPSQQAEAVSMDFVTMRLSPGERIEIGPGEGKNTGRTGMIKKSAGQGKWLVTMDDDDSDQVMDDDALLRISYGRSTKRRISKP